MVKKKTLIVALLAFLSTTATFAQSTKIKDVRTNPNLFFLQDGQQPSSLDLLPPPPSVGSMQWYYDESQYQWGKSLRDTPRGDQAAADARVEGDGVPHAFSEAFGTEISKENAPEIYKLVLKMREDAGDLATRSAKNHYMRIRPFAYYKENTCNPAQQKELSTNGSYPSGHTTIGWAEALVLAEINVDRQNEILKRGYEMGQSRVICGYHWQSDVDAARLCAAAVVARLHADPAFQKQLQKAKNEFARLVKAGKVAKSTFTLSK
ncbi:MAG TPA: acid phosphatase [Prevotella sp.]|nr:acid phosphatase [Prevotella sp.]